MWDPVSVFALCWMLNVGMPEARLSVNDLIQIKESAIITNSLSRDVSLREEYVIKD